MKAIQIHKFGDPEVMQIETVSDLSPEFGQVLIEVKAVGVNPVDTYIRAGNYPIKKEFPFTPGFDAAGVVLKVGPGVEDLAAGDRVYTAGSVTGTYAQQTVCPAELVNPLPDNISFEQGAALGVPYSTAWRAIFQRGRAVSGQWVLIHGASGGVGIAAVQIAAAAGLQIIATAGTEEGRRLAKEHGAHHVLDHNDPDHMKEVLKITHGVDLLLEMLANVNLGTDLEAMALKSCIVIIGSRGNVEIDPRYIMARELDVHGLLLMRATDEERRQIASGIEKGLKKGTLNPIIDKRFPLDQAPRAHHEIMETTHLGKIILLP